MTTAILPDGTELEFPDDTPQHVIDGVVKSHIKPETGITDRVLQGMRDPIDAGAQLLEHGLNKIDIGGVNVGDTINQANNWLADKTGLVAKLPDGGVDQQIRDRASDYHAPEGMDFARMGGNLLSPTNIAIASKLPIAATAASKLLSGVGAGAVTGALQPVENGNFADEKVKQMEIGAATGGALSVAGNVAGKVISPSVRQDVKTLIDNNITPTVGQILGGGFQAMENKATSIPFVGDMIKNAQRRAVGDLNRSTVNRALSIIKDKLPSNLSGRQAIDYADTKLSDAYDNVLAKIGAVKPDGQFAHDIQSLSQLTQNLPATEQDQFSRIILNEIQARINPQGFMTSEGLKAAESNLGNAAKGYLRGADYDKRQLGAAIQEAQNTLRTMLERVAPSGTAAELKAVNRAYATFMRPQRASSSLGADQGEFTAAQLQNSVKALDPSRNKKQFSKGKAMMQDLSEPAKAVLTTYPDSGTPGRAMIAGLPYMAGAAYAAPVPAAITAVTGGLAAAPYTKAGQELLSWALTGRQGNGSKAVADTVKKYTPALSPSVVPLIADLLNGYGQ